MDLALQAVLTVAVIWDFRRERIPNLLIVFGLAVGIGWRMLETDTVWYQILPGIGFPILFCYILFLMHALGAGDIKLFSVIGCFWPFQDLLLCMILSFVTGGVISISKLLIHRQLFESLSCFFHYIQQVNQTHRIEKYPGRDVTRRQMHFSLAIYIGFFLTLGVKYGKIFNSFM